MRYKPNMGSWSYDKVFIADEKHKTRETLYKSMISGSRPLTGSYKAQRYISMSISASHIIYEVWFTRVPYRTREQQPYQNESTSIRDLEPLARKCLIGLRNFNMYWNHQSKDDMTLEVRNSLLGIWSHDFLHRLVRRFQQSHERSRDSIR